MKSDEYMTQRLDDQIQWYDAKSTQNQCWYKGLRTVQFAAAALIPFLTGVLTTEGVASKLVVGLLGVAIAIITATLDLFRFQEHWIEYRTTSETLKKERLLFLTESDPYGHEISTRFQLLVQRVEGLISKENSNWAQYVREPVKGKDD